MYNFGLGFVFNEKTDSSMNCALANSSNCMRLLTDDFTANSETVDGYDGGYPTGETVNMRKFDIQIYVDDITDKELANIGAWLKRGAYGKLTFLMQPYKYYLATVTSGINPPEHVRFDSESNLYRHTGLIDIEFTAYTPYAYLYDDVRDAYPSVGTMKNTLDAGSGIMSTVNRPPITGNGNLVIANLGTAIAKPEIWVTGVFKSGTVISNRSTGRQMVLYTNDTTQRTLCIDSTLGTTVQWVSATHPTTTAIHANNITSARKYTADVYKTGNFITLIPCIPIQRNMSFTYDGKGLVTFSETPNWIEKKNQFIRIGSDWVELTSINGCTATATCNDDVYTASAYSGSSDVITANKIEVIPGAQDSVSEITFYFKDTFY